MGDRGFIGLFIEKGALEMKHMKTEKKSLKAWKNEDVSSKSTKIQYFHN